MDILLSDVAAKLSDVGPYLLLLAVKATVVSCLVLGIGAGIRRGGVSAAVRHLCYSLALLSLLLLPAFSLLVPAWSVLPGSKAMKEEAFRQPLAVTTSPARATTTADFVGESAAIREFPAVPDTVQAVATTTGEMITRRESMGVVQPSRIALPSAAAVGVFVYLLGVALCAVRIIRGAAAASHLGRLCEPVTNWRLTDALEAVIQTAGLKGMVSLRGGERVTVPMTLGWPDAIILLPAEATEWPVERLRAVLLHEAAHIRRGDYVWQMIGQTACALFWYHPGAWLLMRRMREEAEYACDDRVLLKSGSAAWEYAEHLLDIARGGKAARLDAPAAVVAMARKGDLGQRLTAILSERVNRSAVSGTRAGLLALTALVGMAPLAALRQKAGAAAAAELTAESRVQQAVLARPADATVALTDGFELGPLQITETLPSGQVRAWDTQGGTVRRADPKFIGAPPRKAIVQAGRSRLLWFNTFVRGWGTGRIEDDSVDIAFGVVEDGTTMYGNAGTVSTSRGDSFFGVSQPWEVPDGWRQADLFCAVAHGKGEVLISGPLDKPSVRTLPDQEKVHLDTARKNWRDKKGRPYSVWVISAYLPRSYTNLQAGPPRYGYALEFLRKNGVVQQITRTFQTGNVIRFDIPDSKFDAEAVQEIRLRVRKFDTHYFRNVPLQPATDNAVETAEASASSKRAEISPNGVVVR